MTADRQVTIVEVGPRDGFQPIVPWIPTETKVDIIARILGTGIRRVETTSFASATAVPQLRDAPDVVAACARMQPLIGQVLVPTGNYARKAITSGADRIAFVLSVSEAHNQSNVRRTVAESITDLRNFLAGAQDAIALTRLNLATAFDCPFTGRVAAEAVLQAIEQIGELPATCEVCLCDTTGRADPVQVGKLFTLVAEQCRHITRWAFHAHDTYGLGAANCYAAYQSGVHVFDGAIGGLGGCPFAPGATGNVATEDLVWMFERAGLKTGIDLTQLVNLADDVVSIPGAFQGGRVRQALGAASTSSCR